jgi:hypothetical protein
MMIGYNYNDFGETMKLELKRLQAVKIGCYGLVFVSNVQPKNCICWHCYYYDRKYTPSTCLATLNPSREIIYAVKSGRRGERSSSERIRNGRAVRVSEVKSLFVRQCRIAYHSAPDRCRRCTEQICDRDI